MKPDVNAFDRGMCRVRNAPSPLSVSAFLLPDYLELLGESACSAENEVEGTFDVTVGAEEINEELPTTASGVCKTVTPETGAAKVKQSQNHPSSCKELNTLDMFSRQFLGQFYLSILPKLQFEAQRGGVQGSNPEILDLCLVASGSYHMVNSLGLSISSPPWLLGGTSCDLPPPPKA
ncbi:Uncharacterized protein Fot_42525 [Forsythia ovata]|uniref:Uncharacterized protein n=1 Tax=Forsythia ovata TaxID=205694 RepID=A0ABD1RN70_9LAMI